MRPYRQSEGFAATESLLTPAPRRRGPGVTFSTTGKQAAPSGTATAAERVKVRARQLS